MVFSLSIFGLSIQVIDPRFHFRTFSRLSKLKGGLLGNQLPIFFKAILKMVFFSTWSFISDQSWALAVFGALNAVFLFKGLFLLKGRFLINGLHLKGLSFSLMAFIKIIKKKHPQVPSFEGSLCWEIKPRNMNVGVSRCYCILYLYFIFHIILIIYNLYNNNNNLYIYLYIYNLYRTFAEWGVDYVKLDGCYSDPATMAVG